MLIIVKIIYEVNVMQIKLPPIRIPEQMSLLLSMDIHDTRKSYARVADILYTSKFLTMLIEKYYVAFEKWRNLEEILNHTGWVGFRNRLTCVYLEYALNGHYPQNPSLDLATSISDFERKFENYSITGFGRSFLLGFYLRLVDIHLQHQGGLVEEGIIQRPLCVLDILKLGKLKHEKLDWLIMLIWHLQEFWGTIELEQKIKATNGNFYRLIDELDDESKEHMIDNFLSYGYAIGQDDIFLFEKV